MNEELKILQLQSNRSSSEVDEQESLHCFDSGTCVTTEQFSKICRTCLTEGDHKSIFDITYEQKAAAEILKLYASVQVKKSAVVFY